MAGFAVGRLDEKGETMNRLTRWLIAILIFAPFAAHAHVGSPDVFFEGNVGPYPAHITIRMPTVVPGRAEISVHVDADQPVEVSFLPVFSQTAVSNAPPPDAGVPILGETNYYSGELWLMTFGAYSIQVQIHGAAGSGSIEIPVNSLATSQLPLPGYLGKILIALALVLVIGGIAVIVGAAREATVEPGATPTPRDRRKGWIAGSVTTLVFVVMIVGGNAWWKSEEKDFRKHLRGGAYPDITGKVRMDGPQRVLDLAIGNKAFEPDYSLSLLPDHGKLLHFFLIREDDEDAFAHIHPVRTGGKTFAVAVPPLPAGRYRMFCDLTFERTGLSFTAADTVEIPAAPETTATNITLAPDPDDSWAVYPAASVKQGNGTNLIYNLPSGGRVVWRAHPPLRVHQDAGLQFEIWDADGHAASLEPYMGMVSHAAVLRRDGSVFAHLHPSGNFSMAAQGFFQAKMNRESGDKTSGDGMAGMPGMEGMNMAGMDHSKMHHAMPHLTKDGVALISLPYEFPSAGDYRVWVQFKTGGQVQTAVFDASVAP
ncbi:MAG TPA: hypothetical protein VH413_02045 [Verrucomicrobiae bacterium]|nr:hypothetical protein [Verrucomicrobiae bacterium]